MLQGFKKNVIDFISFFLTNPYLKEESNSIVTWKQLQKSLRKTVAPSDLIKVLVRYVSGPMAG